MVIVVIVGIIDVGVIDLLCDIVGIVVEYQIWLYVDVVWGGVLLLFEQYCDYFDGLELVDFVILDFYKQFFQIISCGVFLLKDVCYYELMCYQVVYLNFEFDEEYGVLNLVFKLLQIICCFDVLKLWMGLEVLGQKQYVVIIDYGVMMVKNVVEYVKLQLMLELVMQLQLVSVLFCFCLVQMVGSDVVVIVLFNQCVGDVLLVFGCVNVGVIEYNGVICLKLILLNLVVMLDDVKVLLNLVECIVQELLV